jgi:pimeloyl-ACP methyl ester carboxylesterase
MQRIRAGDADIAFDVTGVGDPLLLIMGLGADSKMWMLQTPTFSERLRCITFDNRGVGESSIPEGPYSTEQMAGDALAVLDALDVERAHVLGISLGGAIAQQVALKAPERVRSLVLAATWAEQNAYTARMARVGRIIADIGHDALVRASMLWLFSPEVLIDNPKFVDDVEALALQFAPDPQAFLRQLDAVEGHDTSAGLPQLDVPTRVLVARHDIMVPPELGRRVAALIPAAELLELDGAHAFNFESVEAFNQAVLEFVQHH